MRDRPRNTDNKEPKSSWDYKQLKQHKPVTKSSHKLLWAQVVAQVKQSEANTKETTDGKTC